MDEQPVSQDHDAPESGGDAACWLHLVCEDCGAVVTPSDGHRPDCNRFVAAQPVPEPRR